MLALGMLSAAQASPSFKVLYHEAIHLQSRQPTGKQQHWSFDAYGRHFDLTLEPNEEIRQAVPAERSDIVPFRGVLDGEPGSWARLTRTRAGWRGLLFDGHDLYAIAPTAEVVNEMVQPLSAGSSPTDRTAPVIYRLDDALMSSGAAFCKVATVDGTAASGGSGAHAEQPRETALMAYQKLVSELGTQAAQVPTRRLNVGIVADYEFFEAFNPDPEGAIIARMDIVDGIYSSQLGIKLSLAPLVIFTTPQEPFTATDPTTLLSQLRSYRGATPSQMLLGVTHLMTGRDLDGDIVGIAYLGSVCNGDAAASLSEGVHSTTMSALIAAHELGHNFNAPHDGEAGACATTPQTFLMAPRINFSDQFSACSLQQIRVRMQTAQCLVPYNAPNVSVQGAAGTVPATVNTAFSLSFTVRATGDDPSTEVTASASLPAGLTVQSAAASTGTCTTSDTGVSCSLGSLASGASREVDLMLVPTATGNLTGSLSVASSNDSVMTDNSAQVAIDVTDTAGASSHAAGTAAASGGGGGGVDVVLLAALATTVGLRVGSKRKWQSFPRASSRQHH
ncbi:MAG TPA: M12 family metallo-peptidase [Steroidobacteraceae bacterium]|nr:M12 family metallo-peptidase [Steroidobacteraceae bacterium]